MNLQMVLLSATLACLVLLSSFHSSHSQSYHYSNGWNPGKKRSSSSSATSTSTDRLPSPSSSRNDLLSLVLQSESADSPCSLRPSVKKLVLDLLEIEIRRVAEDCSADTEWIPVARTSDNQGYSRLSRWLAKNSRDLGDADPDKKRK